MSTIREEVRRFIVDRIMTASDAGTFNDETNLRECGILDSFSALNLVSFIEERFEIQLQPSDVESGSLFSLNGIEGLVLLRSPPSTGLYEYFRAAALKHAARTALIDSGSQLTYREVLARVDVLGQTMSAHGVRAGTRVAVILGNTLWFVIAILGAWQAGATVIPLNPKLPDEELLKHLLDSRPEGLILSTKNRALPALLEARDAAPENVWLPPVGEGDWIHDTAPNGNRPTIDNSSCVIADSPALIQYSAGSTGTPKRVTRTHGQLVGEFEAISQALPLTPDDRVLGVIPFFHSHGLKNAALLPLFAGAALYVLDTFLPRHVVQLMEKEKITVLPGIPFMFQQLANLREPPELSSLRLAFSGSAALPNTTARGFESAFGIKIRRVYGATETGLISVERSGGIFDELNRAGHPLPGVTVQIVDEAGAPVPSGTDGRVKVTSPYAASGYDRSDTNGSSYFEADSYFPGDIGRVLDTSELVLIGRHRPFINVGGNKVDAVEVEAALLELPGVSEAVVLGVPDPLYGERVEAVLVTTRELSREEVRAHLVGRLAEYKHPRQIQFRKELPRDSMGKVQKKSLSDRTPSD